MIMTIIMIIIAIVIIIIIIIIKLKADVDLLHHTNTDAYNVFLRLITLPGSMFPTLYKSSAGPFTSHKNQSYERADTTSLFC